MTGPTGSGKTTTLYALLDTLNSDDVCVLTAEDPRTESLDGILEEMAVGAKSKGGREGETFWRIADRGEAIKFAIRLAKEGDIVLSCGKGHEQSMCFGKTEYLWDDRTAMRAALAELLGKTNWELFPKETALVFDPSSTAVSGLGVNRRAFAEVLACRDNRNSICSAKFCGSQRDLY